MLAMSNYIFKRTVIMENAIIIGILLIVIVVALLRARKHFKGGGCCGSGSTTVRSNKKLTEPKLGEYTLTLEGMHCENCQNRVEHVVNQLDGVVCKANWKKGTAVVSYSRKVPPEEIKAVIEKKGYNVTSIR